MRLIFLILSASLIFFAGCRNKSSGPDGLDEGPASSQSYALADSFLIVPGKSMGIVHSDFNYDSLVKYVGAENIEDDSTCGIECIDTFIVTVLWKGKPRETEIMWQDSFFHQKIALVSIYSQQSPYHTAEGISPSSTLEFLEKLNGKPINFRGFGWDYGGGVTSYNGGRLDTLDISLTLDCDQPDCNNKYLGEAEFSTLKVDATEKKKIHVSELFINFQ